MSQFPTLVYKCPGDHEAYGGQTYRYAGIADEAELQTFMANGWFMSLPEAVKGEHSEPVDNSPPTREELEDKAKELGIIFDGRTSDKTLLRRIEEEIELDSQP